MRQQSNHKFMIYYHFEITFHSIQYVQVNRLSLLNTQDHFSNSSTAFNFFRNELFFGIFKLIDIMKQYNFKILNVKRDKASFAPNTILQTQKDELIDQRVPKITKGRQDTNEFPENSSFESTLIDLFEKSLTILKNQQKNQLQKNKSDKKIEIKITNEHTKSVLEFGNEFKEMIESRDQVLEHNFKMVFQESQQSLEQYSKDFLNSKLYKQIERYIKRFLVETVSNIVSIAFNHLLNKRLQDKEAKCFAAKNIMLNVQSIYRQIFRVMENTKALGRVQDQSLIKVDLIQKIQKILANIFENLQDHYPMAEATGGTRRMRQVVYEVDRLDNEEVDFIYANNIKIADYINNEEDYTAFIMKVVNTIIQVTQSSQNDARQRTVRQIFTEFNEQLFYSAQKQNNSSLNSSQAYGNPTQTDSFFINFEKILSNTLKKQEEIQKIQQANFHQQSKRKAIQKMIEEKRYAIGQKVPNFVKPFNRQEIAQQKFTAKHSSILRILTKWAGYLQDVFTDATEHLRNRLYPFKNTNNQLILDIQEGERKEQIIKILVKQLSNQHKKVTKKLNILKNKNVELISKILYKKNESFLSNVQNFSQTRQVSSNINTVLTTLMINYISILIHHILRAGQHISINTSKYNTKFADFNLISFKVSDLMRAKFQTNERSFINLVKILYQLDQKESMKNKFKLIRIKNKLDDPANNIMINFLFMGKIQCELQLSIQQAKGKEKIYYSLSHFLYEIVRGKFGYLTEMAIMISQLDPMMNANKLSHYEQKGRNRDIQNEKVISQKKDDCTSILNTNFATLIFDCDKCGSFVVQKRKQMNGVIEELKLCRQCLMKQKELQIHNKQLKQILDNLMSQKKIIRNNKLQQINKDNHYFLSINQQQQVDLGLVFYNQLLSNHYLIMLNRQFLSLRSNSHLNLDFKNIDYINMEKTNIIKEFTNKNFIFQINLDLSELLREFLKLNIIKQIKEEEIFFLIREFKQYQQEKALIKLIKHKSQRVKIVKSNQKLKMLQNIINCLAKSCHQQTDISNLRYKSCKYLQLSKIETIQLVNMTDLIAIPQWIDKFKKVKELTIQNCNIRQLNNNMKNLQNLQIVNFARNKLQQLKGLQFLNNLKVLKLSFNKIETLENIQNLLKLQQLNLDSNQIKEINCLTNLYKLKILSLSKNKGLNINSLIYMLNLQQINLVENDLQDIQIVSSLIHLKKLNLSYNKISSIQSLSRLTNLQTLLLKNNQIQQISSLSKLTNLETLNLSNNYIQNIQSLQNLIHLRKLNLMSNRIKNIKPISTLTKLYSLNLTSNEFSNIDSLSTLSNLKELFLYQNYVDSCKGVSTLKKIRQFTAPCYIQQEEEINYFKILLNQTKIYERIRQQKQGSS